MQSSSCGFATDLILGMYKYQLSRRSLSNPFKIFKIYVIVDKSCSAQILFNVQDPSSIFQVFDSIHNISQLWISRRSKQTYHDLSDSMGPFLEIRLRPWDPHWEWPASRWDGTTLQCKKCRRILCSDSFRRFSDGILWRYAAGELDKQWYGREEKNWVPACSGSCRLDRMNSSVTYHAKGFFFQPWTFPTW